MVLETEKQVDMLINSLSAALKNKIKLGQKVQIQMYNPKYEQRQISWDGEESKHFIRTLIEPGKVIIHI